MRMLNGRLIAVAALGALAAAPVAVAAPPKTIAGARLKPRAGAVAPGTKVKASALLATRVFANANDGFTLAGVGQAQYPARSTDGGRTWKIDGPQVHVNAADAPEAVSFVGVAGPRRLFAYGSQAVDVTTDGGKTWWEAFLGDLVAAVVPGPGHRLLAFVQNASGRHAVTSQYVSSDGGRHWRLSAALGG